MIKLQSHRMYDVRVHAGHIPNLVRQDRQVSGLITHVLLQRVPPAAYYAPMMLFLAL